MTNNVDKSKRPLERPPAAIVVGASSGVGAALTRELARQGYQVAAVARREAKLAELCQSINAASANGVQARYYTHNVTKFAETAALFQQITNDLGGLDLLIYNAGVQPANAINEYNFEKDRSMVEVNLLGAMAWLSQAAVRFERAGGGQIAATSSIAADRGRVLNPGYNGSKAGLDVYLEGLRNRLSRHGVNVTTIRLGMVDTVLLENSPRTMWVISPEEAAARIYKAIRRKKQVTYIPARWRYVGLVLRHIPSVIFRRLSF